MACGCSRSRTFTQSNPVVLGDPNGDPAAHFRATVAIMGMKANQDFWATGTDVGPMTVAGWLIAL